MSLRQLIHQFEHTHGRHNDVRRFYNHFQGGHRAPDNIKGVDVFKLGPWSIMLFGETHVYDSRSSERSLHKFISHLLTQVDNQTPHNLCLDAFIETALDASYNLKLPRDIQAIHDTLSGDTLGRFLFYGNPATLQQVMGVFERARKHSFKKIDAIRVHKMDVRINFAFALDEKFNFPSGIVSAICVPAVQMLFERRGTDKSIKHEIVRRMRANLFYDFTTYTDETLTQIADMVIEYMNSVRERMDAEYKSIHLPATLKAQLSRQKLFSTISYADGSTLQSMYSLLMQAAPMPAERYQVMALTVGAFLTDSYTFYRLLKSYNPYHAKSVSHDCPTFNQISIYYGGDMHRQSILSMFKYFHRLIYRTELVIMSRVPPIEVDTSLIAQFVAPIVSDHRFQSVTDPTSAAAQAFYKQRGHPIPGQVARSGGGSGSGGGGGGGSKEIGGSTGDFIDQLQTGLDFYLPGDDTDGPNNESSGGPLIDPRYDLDLGDFLGDDQHPPMFSDDDDDDDDIGGKPRSRSRSRSRSKSLEMPVPQHDIPPDTRK